MKKRVLIVDDTIILAESIADTLRMEGFAISFAYNGKHAIAVIENEKPDLILTDLVMPEMNGLEFIRYVRAQQIYSTIPIIVLTADTNEENVQEGISAGANLLLHKPFDIDYLIDSILKLLSNE